MPATATTGPTWTVATTPDFGAKASTFEALADPVRLQLLWLIAARPMNVNDLCNRVLKRQQAVSHHLKILTLKGLTAYERDGRSNIYSVTAAGKDALSRAWG